MPAYIPTYYHSQRLLPLHVVGFNRFFFDQHIDSITGQPNFIPARFASNARDIRANT